VTEEMTMTVGAIPIVPDGTYPATLIGLEDFEAPDFNNPEDTKTLRRWTFGLDGEVDVDGNPAEIDGVSSTALGPRSKAYGWIEALLGRKLEKGETVTRSSLLNKTCLVTVEQNDDGYSKIAAVVPTPKARGGTSPASQKAAETPLVTYPDSPPRLKAAGVTTTELKEAVQASTGLEVDVDDIPF
jgi:hypothetical protein